MTRAEPRDVPALLLAATGGGSLLLLQPGFTTEEDTVPAAAGDRLVPPRASCLPPFPQSPHGTELPSGQPVSSRTSPGQQKHGEFVHTSITGSKFLLLILNIIHKRQDHAIPFSLARVEKMDVFPAPANESSGPAGWDPFRRPLASVQPWHFRLLAAAMLVVTSLSLAENLAVILVTSRFQQLRQPLNYVIVNLSVADFLVSLTGGTISFLANLRGYFYMGRWACVLEGFAVTFFGIVALWSLALLAFERYIVICRPLGNTRLRGKHAALGIAFVWSFSFLWTIPPTMGWSSYTTSKIGTTCEPNWYSRAYTDHTYIITFFTTCFIVPLLVILVSYGKLMQKLRKVSDAQGRLGTTRKPERQVTRMVVVMIVAFLICWTPYAAFSILVTACPSVELDPRLAAIPAFFSKTATVYNPIIYVFMNKQFRKCLIQMFSCSNTETAESNVNPTSERAALTPDKRGTEMSPMAARTTLSSRKTGGEHRNCRSFAQPAASENKIHPM